MVDLMQEQQSWDIGGWISKRGDAAKLLKSSGAVHRQDSGMKAGEVLKDVRSITSRI